jgi:hypothetical protein
MPHGHIPHLSTAHGAPHLDSFGAGTGTCWRPEARSGLLPAAAMRAMMRLRLPPPGLSNSMETKYMMHYALDSLENTAAAANANMVLAGNHGIRYPSPNSGCPVSSQQRVPVTGKRQTSKPRGKGLRPLPAAWRPSGLACGLSLGPREEPPPRLRPLAVRRVWRATSALHLPPAAPPH